MLEVTKILEGGLDLRTGQELCRGLVITNGRSEVIIPIPQEKVTEIVSLIADEMGIPTIAEQAVQFRKELLKNHVAPNPQKQPVAQLAEVFEDSLPEMEEDDGFKPGEEYADPDTGLDSL